MVCAGGASILLPATSNMAATEANHACSCQELEEVSLCTVYTATCGGRMWWSHGWCLHVPDMWHMYWQRGQLQQQRRGWSRGLAEPWSWVLVHGSKGLPNGACLSRHAALALLRMFELGPVTV